MDLIDEILSGNQKSGVSPEVLEILGRKAANMYLQQGVSLNDAIAKVVKSEKNLTNEHLKRIVEFANNVTFQQLFESGSDKNVHFPVADPGVVTRTLADGSAPNLAGKLTADYSLPPKQEKASDIDGGLNELFKRDQQTGSFGQGEPIAKTASAKSNFGSHADPRHDVYDFHIKLSSIRDQFRSTKGQLTGELNMAKEAFYEAVRNEVLDEDGSGIGGVIDALDKTFASNEKIASALNPVIDRLVRDGIPLDTLKSGLTKTAGSLVNKDHPVIELFSRMNKLAEDIVRTNEALKEVEAGLKQTNSFIRKAI